MEMCAVADPVVRFGLDQKVRLYYAACFCLLVAATGLRFHDLSEHYLWHDEAAVADIARGSLSGVVSGTRCCNSSPILYPFVMYAVQKVESTPFSIRVVPATASVLTVAVMLFLLPRLGVARSAAFLAGLLATLSVESIRHAQDAREYSVDALVALLMVAGLLRYLRDGRKALLCVCLFLGPLLQYGLVLFGVAVLATAAAVPPTSARQRRGTYFGRTGHWLRGRLDLVAPTGFFLAAGTFSYLMTMRYQCAGQAELCFQKLVAALTPRAGNRLWLGYRASWEPPWIASPRVRLALGADVSIEHVVSGGEPNLYLIEDTESLKKNATATDGFRDVKLVLPGKPLARSTFDIYLDQEMLIYFKAPCGEKDVLGTFSLHVYPADVNELPEHRKRYGFDNLDFRFDLFGSRLAEACVAQRELPDYDFTAIRAGQYVVGRNGLATGMWEEEIHFDE